MNTNIISYITKNENKINKYGIIKFFIDNRIDLLQFFDDTIFYNTIFDNEILNLF